VFYAVLVMSGKRDGIWPVKTHFNNHYGIQPTAAQDGQTLI